MSVCATSGSSRSCRRVGRAAAVAAAIVLAGSAPGTGSQPPAGAARCIVGLEHVRTLLLPDTLRLRDPTALAVDHRGDIVIADTGNHRVLVCDSDGAVVAEFGGHGWDDGQFDRPGDVSVYAGFFIYVLDEGNNRVERFDVDGNYVDRIVESGEAGTPVSMAIGPEGSLFLVDADSQTVLKWSQFDEKLAPLGWFGGAPGGLIDPRGLAIGPSREIAVADPGRFSVTVFDEFGSALYALSLPDSLSADDLLFDESACVVVADRARGALVAFAPDGTGPTATVSWDTDGFHPVALALSGRDVVLALDADGRRILVIRMIHDDCRAGR